MSEIEQLFEQLKTNSLDTKRYCKLSQDDRDKLEQLWIAYLKTKKMATLTIIEKTNNAGEPVKHGATLVIDSEKLIGVGTKSLYVRKGFKNGTLFLSQRGNGANGAGDICKINEDAQFEVNSKLFDRLTVYAEKANAIVK